MNAILEIDTDNFVAVAEAGVVTQTLQEAVEAKGLYYPPDPASRGSCMIGGNVAENAGGPHAAKYGVTGRWVMGLEAVFADGGVAVTGGKTRKDVAGYDLTSLLLGSEGTLARRHEGLAAPHPEAAFLGDARRAVPDAGRRGALRARAAPARPRAFGLRVRGQAVRSTSRRRRRASACRFPRPRRASSSSFDGPSEAEVERDVTLAGEIAARVRGPGRRPRDRRAEAARLWDVRRGIAEAVHELGVSAELDLAVPRTELVALVTAIRRISGAAELKSVAFGHAADGNLHVHLWREGKDPAATGRSSRRRRPRSTPRPCASAAR